MGEPNPPEDALGQRLRDIGKTPEYLAEKTNAERLLAAGDIYHNFPSKFPGGPHRNMHLELFKDREAKLGKKYTYGDLYGDKTAAHSQLYLGQNADEFFKTFDEAILAEGITMEEINQMMEDIMKKPEVREERIRELLERTTGVYARLICLGYTPPELR